MNIDARLRRIEHALAKAATHDGTTDVREILASPEYAAICAADDRAQAEGHVLTDDELVAIAVSATSRKKP